MEKQRKRVWKRRSSHSMRVDAPDSVDHDPEHEETDESNVQCTNCGSLHTRASSALELNFDVIFKGNLYRCRQCKAHFRARPPKTEFTRVGSIAGATTVGLLLVILGVANRERISGFFWSLQPGRAQQEQVQQPVKQRQPGGFTNEDAEDLTNEVVGLYQTADLYHKQFPAMERAYRDVIGNYKDLLDKEAEAQRGAGSSFIAGRLQRVSAEFADTLQRGHDMLVKDMGTLRLQTTAANRLGGRRLQECAQMKGKPVANVSRRSCDELVIVLATLKTNTEQAELDFTGSEQVYDHTVREINRIAVESIGHRIFK